MRFEFAVEVMRVLPAVEFDRRLPGLLREFGQPSDKPMIPGCNVDMQYLPPLARIVVSTAHSVVRCHVCDDDMWLGPNQRNVNGTRICYICVALLTEGTKEQQQPKVRMLDPDADRVPRRFQ